MFDNNSSSACTDNDRDLLAPGPSRIESILLTSCLPNYVKTAAITSVWERLIDDKEILRLTKTETLETDDPATIERLGIRKKALSGHLGTNLICVLIRLPGASYTVEIDPTTDSIIHWEWQEA